MSASQALAITALVCLFAPAACMRPQGNTPQDRRDYIDDFERNTLSELYRLQPDAKKDVENGFGHAVFSTIGTKLFLAGGGNGFGVCVDKATGKRTYMRMGQVDVGPGFGIKTLKCVFVFRTKAMLTRFVTSGWQWGGQAEATAKVDDIGGTGAVDAKAGPIGVYRITGSGVALQATVNGTRYWPDDKLN